jgi:hypothetical protein
MRLSASRWLCLLCLVCSLLGAETASSTTLIPLNFQEIVTTAESAFLGEVVSRRSDWNVGPHGRSIFTLVTFKVERVLKGQLGPQVQLRFRGGQIGSLVMRVAGMPQFNVGDRDVLFLSAERNTVSPLVGFSYGRFHIMRDPVTRIDQVRGPDGAPFVGAADVPRAALSPTRVLRPMTYPEFERAVTETIVRGLN